MNQYDGDITSPHYFQYVKASIPIIVSAPHATNHVNRDEEFKMSDTYTGTLGLLLHELTDCHLIYLTKQANRNPNGEWKSEYRDVLSSIVQNEAIHLLIDLHASARHRDFDVDFGNNYGKTISKDKMDTIKGIFFSNQILQVKENNTFKAPFPTITFFSKEILYIDAIQMEIHKKFREPTVNLTLFNQMLKAIYEIILHFSS